MPTIPRRIRMINRVLSLLDAHSDGDRDNPALTEAVRLVVEELHQPLPVTDTDSADSVRAAIKAALLREIFSDYFQAQHNRADRQ